MGKMITLIHKLVRIKIFSILDVVCFGSYSNELRCVFVIPALYFLRVVWTNFFLCFIKKQCEGNSYEPSFAFLCCVLFSLCGNLSYASPVMRATNVTSMQAAIPVSVGIRKAAAVHFQLPVSLWMVRQVVEQGQCSREKSIVHTAVSHVHPLATSSSWRAA